MSFNSLKAELGSWSLGSDQKLFELLQSFSRQLDEKSNSCLRHVDELRFEVLEAEVGLRNTFNEFLMLGSSQFIENVCPTKGSIPFRFLYVFISTESL
jgi:hypothetical protein